MSAESPLKIGILGAARIAPMALIRPAAAVPEVEVFAMAARDQSRARRFAVKHSIPRVHGSYDELISDPKIEAVYNPLPNGLHCEWTIKALEAGKHVLCEKPLAANTDEAERMADAAAKAGLVLGEAFHWRYHPLAARMKEIVDGGALGRIRHLEATLCFPLPFPSDIRYRFDLGGGALMDAGCYPISMVRFLAGAEPEVVSADSRLASPDVDRWMRAELRFADGRSGRITCGLFSSTLLKLNVRVEGDEGTLSVFNPIAPHFYNRVKVTNRAGTETERVRGDATYVYQLRAFARAVRGGEPLPTDGAHGVANMRVIDAIYDAAGIKRRGT